VIIGSDRVREDGGEVAGEMGQGLAGGAKVREGAHAGHPSNIACHLAVTLGGPASKLLPQFPQDM